jgi:hypothetical protein
VIRMPSVGDHLGRYRLLRVLGHGGMGVVYAALDTALDREVALKIITPQLAADEDYRARFRREAQALSRVESPHVVAVHDHGELDGCLHLVTALVPDGDLFARVRDEGAPAPRVALDLVVQVLDGLEDAHRAGVVHRDVKPSNVLLRRRGERLEAVLCDFGIASLPGSEVTRTGGLVGSYPYMAPERHQGRQTGVAGDVYSTGCLLWHVLTGAAPYSGTDVEVALAHLQAPVPQLPEVDDTTRDLNRVLARAMAKEPGDRYPSARAMRRELATVLEHAPAALALPAATSVRHSVLPAVAALDTAAPAARRGRRAAALAGTAVGAVLVAAIGAYAGLSAGEGTVRTVAGPDGPTLTTTVTAQPVAVAPGATLSTQQPPRSRPTPRSGTLLLPEEPGDPTSAAPTRSSGGRGGAGGGRGLDTQAGPVDPTAGPSGRPTTKASPTKEPAPKADFHCWDGSEVVGGASACPDGPTGATGLRWMFATNASCTSKGTTAEQVSAMDCTISTPHGAGRLRMIQWVDVPTMKKQLSAYNGGKKPFKWTYGPAWARQTKQHPATPYMRTNAYGDKRFSINLYGATEKARTWLIGHTGYRVPSQYRGYPID